MSALFRIMRFGEVFRLFDDSFDETFATLTNAQTFGDYD